MGCEHNHRVVPGPITERDMCKIKEAVCVQVEKIYDSCREKDCIEDAKVMFWRHDISHIINRAINVKCRRAEVVDVYADIEPLPFKRGFYTVDVKFFIKVTLDFFVQDSKSGKLCTITRDGLVTYDKKVILFGSEGSVKIYKSHFEEGEMDKPIRSRLQQDNLPVSKVEVAEPIPLSAKIENSTGSISEETSDSDKIPGDLLEELISVEEEFMQNEDSSENYKHHKQANKQVLISFGLFSIIKLVRFVQLLVPAFDFCYPMKECISATDENPCELFDTISFPFDEFYPPQKFEFPGAVEAERRMLNEFRDTHDQRASREGEEGT